MLKTYYVTVDIRQCHIYEVKAVSKEEAYEKIHHANLGAPTEPVGFDTDEPIPGVEYGDCLDHEAYTYTEVEEEEGE